jgi:hypothetical protein
MANIRFSNNASSTLAAGIIAADTSITVASGQGSLFPTLVGGQIAKLTIEDVAGNYEIVHMTVRAGDVLTVVRAQEGTIAQDFASGSRIECRITAAVLDEFIQRAGDTLPGTYDMTGGVLSNGTYQNGEVVNSPIRGDTGVTTNQLVVPSGGGAPTIGGSVIYTAANLTQTVLQGLVFKVGTVMMWYGDIGNIPAGWQACDSTNGTPDLRDKFVIGAGSTYAWSDVGGSTSYVTSAGGGHLPIIQGTVLTANDLPPHSHRLWCITGQGSFGETQGFQGNNGIAADGNASRGYLSTNYGGNQLVENTGTGQAHAHAADAVPDHTHTVSNVRPPFVALYFIMKV